MRFMRSTGLIELGWDLDENMEITSAKSGRNGKGPACSKRQWDITAFIDNDMECLFSILNDKNGNCSHSLQATGWKLMACAGWVPPDLTIIPWPDWALPHQRVPSITILGQAAHPFRRSPSSWIYG